MKSQFLSSVGAAVVALLGLYIPLSVAAEPKMVEKTIYIPGSGEIYKVMVAPEKIYQTIYYGGDIVTMDGEKPVYVEAVVEKNGKIVFAGKRDEAFSKYKENSFEVDLEGKTMLPGFLDPHSHFMSAVRMVNQVNVAAPPVGTATNIPQIIEKLKAFQNERDIKKGDWIIGWGYDQELLEEQRHVTKLDLDAVFPDRKVMLIHVSMHGAVLNSKALEWAGINADARTPAGGVIARMPGSKEPAGLLMEMAYIPVFAKLPQPSEAEMLDLMKPAQMMYASEGYTQAVEGFSHASDLDFLMKAANENRNFIDIVALPGFTEMDKWFDNPKYKFGEYNNKLKLQACKITLDGSPQGKTALVSHPYHTGGPVGEKEWSGESSITQEQLDEVTKKMFDAHIPLQIHTNGDGAIDMMIKTVEKAGITAKDDRRTIIVHSQFQRPEQLPKYVELGLSPSYFTLHTFYWGDVHIKNIGKEAAFFISPMKAAKEAGIVMSNHTDYNVTPLNPFWVMWSAMARESRSGVILGSDQRVDAYTALQALTTGPAWQIFEENRKGKIREGLLADFVILKNNPLKQKISEIKDNKVLATIKEGKAIYINNR
jgi:predicted amidohydrolase YtcJ